MRKGLSKYYPFERARTLIQNENIGSIAMFHKWYKHNKPEKIPKRPDIIYKANGWLTWNDFLGNQNKFKHVKKNFVPYEEAKRFARTLGLKTWEQWIAYSKSGARPPNIPSRPDYYYKEWFTWKDFLGQDLRQIVKEFKALRPILYIIKINNTPSNVFKINVTNGGKAALDTAENGGAKIIATFNYTDDVDWRNIIKNHGNNYWYGEADDYAMSNLTGFLFDMDARLSRTNF